MSIRCNLGAPKEVPREVIERLLAADLDIVDRERRFKALHIVPLHRNCAAEVAVPPKLRHLIWTMIRVL
jgi:hypothetical protein